MTSIAHSQYSCVSPSPESTHRATNACLSACVYSDR